MSIVGARLDDKVAIITGAAQGIGEGIAKEIAMEGASVIIADINENKGLRLSKEIVRKYGPGRAIALSTDVTDENSVILMTKIALQEYGRIDLLICNAGVIRVGSVKTMSLEDFEFVTKVNYTGYFLCVKHVAKAMAKCHRHHPERLMDIIQINSTTGMKGSSMNAAYSGSKFGGIGLTQSFALELLDDGIKVNAICPGSYFEGPLWSDPEKGLFVEYMKIGKIPEAKSIKDIREYYEYRIPMRRGAKIRDIMQAINYIIDQEYETGQTVVVAGGLR